MMAKGLCGVFIGVFVGALAYELLRKTNVAQTAIRKTSEGIRAAKRAFSEGYQSAARPSQARA